MTAGIEIYTMIVMAAAPIGIAFAIGDFIVVTFCRMALGGKLDLRR